MGFTIVNDVTATVNTQSNSGSTSLVVGSGLGAQFASATTANPIRCGVFDSTGGLKFFLDVTARSTDTLTVANRGAESTTDANILTTDVIAAVATNGVLRLFDVRQTGMGPRDFGLSAWSMDPMLASAGLAGTGGRLYLIRIQIPSTIQVSNILVNMSTAGTTLTAGQNFAGLYDSAGNQLAATADQSTAWAGSTGLLTMALTGAPITVTGGSDAFIYAAILANGTTRPSFSCSPTSSTTVSNALLPSTASRNGHVATGQTSLPSTVSTSFTNSQTQLWWVGLS